MALSLWAEALLEDLAQFGPLPYKQGEGTKATQQDLVAYGYVQIADGKIRATQKGKTYVYQEKKNANQS